jgi:hypothetical protein
MAASGWPHIMGGLEEIGAIDGVQQMLLASDEGVLRLFPGWTMTSDARFTTLRASGAFLVSASYAAATRNVTSATVVSEKGRWLTLQNPWALQEGGASVCVRDLSGKSVSVLPLANGHVQFATAVGGQYELYPC